jgi:hypothetical protein
VQWFGIEEPSTVTRRADGRGDAGRLEADEDLAAPAGREEIELRIVGHGDVGLREPVDLGLRDHPGEGAGPALVHERVVVCELDERVLARSDRAPS